MDRLRFGAAILVVICITLAACAANASKLKVPTTGQYIYWIDYTDASGQKQATNPEKFKGKDFDLDLTPLGPKVTNATVTVLDMETGNAAVKPVAPAEGKDVKPLALTPDDFNLVRNVQISITSKDGKPVESAAVTLTDAESNKQTQVIDPTSMGVARFTNVAAGTASVTAVYEGRKKIWDDVDIPIDRESPAFSTTLKISGKVSTVAPPKADESAAGAASPSTKPARPGQAQGSGLAVMLQTVLGIILLAVIASIVYVVLKARGVTAESALKKMGVQLPAGQEPLDSDSFGTGTPQPAAPQVDPTICQFCGQKKDASGNCACSVVGTPSGNGAPTSANGGEPRLIGTQGAYAGSIFPITSDSVTLGREAGNAVPLPQDSTTSRRHATIVRSNGGYTIRDEGSSNGTFLNGAKIAGDQPLRPGDEVQVGSSKFRFETS